MNKPFRFAAEQVLLWVALVGSVQAQRPPPPPAELFFQGPALTQAQLSPDGQHVAMLVADRTQPARLVVVNLGTMKPTVAAARDGAAVQRFRWVNERRLVFEGETLPTLPGQPVVGPGLFAVDADGSAFRQLVETTPLQIRHQPEVPKDILRPGGITGPAWAGVQPGADLGPALLAVGTRLWRTAGPRQDDSVWVVSGDATEPPDKAALKLQRLNTRTGASLDFETPANTVDAVLDPGQHLRMAVTRESGRLQVLWRDNDKQSLGRVQALEARGPAVWRPLALGADGTVYVVAETNGRDALHTWNPITTQLSQPALAASKEFDVSPELLFKAGRLVGARYLIDAEITQWFDPAAKALQSRIDALLPVTANRLSLPERGDSPFVLVQSFADVQPMLTQVYNTQTQRLTQLGVSHPGVSPQQMGLTDFVHYPARDGRQIPAYLTLPPGGGANQNLPLVVLVHDGPRARGATWQWQREVQFLATRGYAVLQPAYRGSTGFGRVHFDAGWQPGGQAMQTDLADAARWAVSTGLADPKRIALAGAGYGGLATLWGLAQEPALYRCGVDWAGMTNISQAQVGVRDTAGDAGSAWQLAPWPAASEDSRDALAAAARIDQPVLLAHGLLDARVPIQRLEPLRDAFKSHSQSVEWVAYANEGEEWRRLETRLDFWSRVERFLARHMPAWN